MITGSFDRSSGNQESLSIEDGFKGYFFFHYNPSLQVFIDNSAKL
jgi:hypothetical protein